LAQPRGLPLLTQTLLSCLFTGLLLKDDTYASWDAFINDLELMFDNAMKFNEEGSLIYNDAEMLKV
jgi:hypothetical protein